MQYLCKLSALLCVCDYNVYLYRTAEPFCPVSLKDECNSVMSWGIWRGREAEITILPQREMIKQETFPLIYGEPVPVCSYLYCSITPLHRRKEMMTTFWAFSSM